jgi:regulator of protease activity HflC (stomatin/prohibitin superfamily)
MVKIRHCHGCNSIINFVPEREAWVVERMGKFSTILQPGCNCLCPLLDSVRYVVCLKEVVIPIPEQEAITCDNVMLKFDAVLYVKVINVTHVCYGVQDPEFAVSELAQTTMRSEVGKLKLEVIFKERQKLNQAIIVSINQAAQPWGLECMRYEIKTIRMPDEIEGAMRLIVEAERKKRALILTSEATAQGAINIAEGEKSSRILRSEGQKAEMVNKAEGVAQSIHLHASARRTALNEVGSALNKVGGKEAASLVMAERYTDVLNQIAQKSKTFVVPTESADTSSLLAQAATLYGALQGSKVVKP